MAEISEVKAALDEIAQMIRAARKQKARALAMIQSAHGELKGLPSLFDDVITTITNYAGSGEFEKLAKDEMGKLRTEYKALEAILASDVTALGG